MWRLDKMSDGHQKTYLPAFCTCILHDLFQAQTQQSVQKNNNNNNNNNKKTRLVSPARGNLFFELYLWQNGVSFV